MTTELENDLAEWMTEGVVSEELTVEEEGWVPSRPEDAERLLRRKAWAVRQEVEIENLAAAEVERIQAWADDRIAGPKRIQRECDRALEGYFRSLVPDGGRVLTLPSGTLRLTAPQNSLIVDDDAVAAEWLLKNLLPGWKLLVAKDELKKATKPGAEEEKPDCVVAPVITEDGETVPGVHYQKPRQASFKASAR